MTDLTIPTEVADGITRANLIEWRNYLQSEMDQWHANPRTEGNPNGYWLHADDVVKNNEYIYACTLLINAFGGEF